MPPACLKKPAFVPVSHALFPEDLHQIKSAWIHVSSVISGTNDSEIRINGIPAGVVPDNVSYAARRFIPLSEQAIAGLGLCNQLEIRMPKSQTFAIGSISLEVSLYDGRTVHSYVANENMVCGQVWQEYRHPERFHTVTPDENVPVQLIFDAKG